MNYKTLFTDTSKAKLKKVGSFSLVFVSERVLTGLLPLGLLYLTNKETYTRLEFIFSLATVLLPVSDLVNRMYFFYGYSVSQQRSRFVSLSFSVFFGQLLLVACILVTCLLFRENDLFYAIARLGYLSLYFFLFDYLRLENRQDRVMMDSILINCVILLFAVLVHLLNFSTNLIFPFMAVLQLGYVVYRLRKQRTLISVWPAKDIFHFLKRSVVYSLPVFANVFIAVFIQNYLKVHFYRTDNEQSMLVLSVLLRLGLSIQIMHALIQSYFAKRIFLNELTFSRFFGNIYMPLILLAGFAVSLGEAIYFRYFNPAIRAEPSTILLVNLYFVVWCTSAIIEIMFSSRNRNVWLLGINVFSLACTFLSFFCFQLERSGNLNKMVGLMSCQPGLFILLVVLFYKKIFKTDTLFSDGS